MITVSGLQKKFNKQHILRDVNFDLAPGSAAVVLGANGSGKSTLVKILSGALEATDNPPLYKYQNRTIEAREAGRLCGIAAPYVALNPMFTLTETLNFHHQMCGFTEDFDRASWLRKAGLEQHISKRLSTFSSGMQQRVRLLLAIANHRPILLLDEPTSNLDEVGIAFYKELIETFRSNKTILVASNYVQHEYEFCTQEIKLNKHY